MDSRQKVQSLSAEAICPLCADFFTEPVSLECGHNFCCSRITQSWEKQEINACLECGQKITERNLRVNGPLANLAEKVRKLNQNQQEQGSKLHCEEHQEELKLFYETDRKLICINCVDSWEHREHRFIPIKEAVRICKDQMKSSLGSLTEKKLAALEVEWQQKEKISQIKKQASNLQAHITFEFIKMHQFLTEKEQHLLQDVREEEERILKAMKENLCEIQENLKSIQEKLLKLESQLEQKDGVIFLKEEASQKRRISDDVNALSLADGALTVGKFQGPLPYPVWSEMLEVINPVLVILDAETMSPELEVSKDLKSLRWARTQRSLPDNEKRFTDCPCALGSEGFTLGRHYWEVEVAGNRGWILGVASESVERKKGINLIPENGFWTIRRFGSQFYVNLTIRSHLPAGQIPGKVGIYLSYESGTVSFYNVDTKSHLHTFTGNKFTEKLYPFLRTSDENHFLRICSGWDPDPEKERVFRVT
ncbi:zinc-binding protein A33-like [Rhincodon typus]|uniref:zinc-binding protein A33-like n=1 Tax=Rhincodon typus TaxID=259920 RepID=UPI00202F834E|nr:zinc-binding protein A33-like [Rhincodon typus]